MARLVAQSGHAFVIPMDGVTFGSDAANHVVIPAEFGVAPTHFAIWPVGGGYFVRDSGSGYGMWINGKPAHETMLSHGDTISAGHLHLAFDDPPPPPVPSPRPTGNFAAAPSGPFGDLPRSNEQGESNRASRYAFESVVEPRSTVSSHLPSPAILPERQPSRRETFASVDGVSGNGNTAVAERSRPQPPSQPSRRPEQSAPVTDVTFEILPEEESLKKSSSPSKGADITRRSPPEHRRGAEEDPFPKITAPSWLPPTEKSEEEKPSGQFIPTPKDKPRGRLLRNTLTTIFLAALLGAAGTARYWGQPLAKKLEYVFSAVFTNESEFDRAVAMSKAKSKEEAVRSWKPPAGSVAEDVHVDSAKAHGDVVQKFIWEQATTLFSLGFPQIEIFYLNEAQQRGLPLPKRYCTFIEKHYGLKISDLERLTSVQVEAEKPGIVIISMQKKTNALDWVGNADVHDEITDSVAGQQLLRFKTSDGVEHGVAVMDDRNFALGAPELLRSCLERQDVTASTASVNSLWPDFMRKQASAFLWTIKLDASLKKQLGDLGSGGPTMKDLAAVQSFAVQFGGEPPRSDCYALRDPNASQEQFATAANSCLKSMVGMLSSQSSNGQRRGVGREMPPIEVSRSAASVEVPGGQEFVNIFLQGFYAPLVANEGPLHSLARARTLAHSFNLARSMNAPESRRVHTVDEALIALQRGMSGSGRASAMEFQVPEMDEEEQRQIRKYLTFADGYLACRPDMEEIPEAMRPLAEEARDRINAETVLSLVPPPPGDRVVKIPDLGAYIRRELTGIKNKRGPMALFGMPQLTDAEMQGVLLYICQAANGKLAWKPGEVSYNAWQAKSNPKAIHDATTLVSLSGAARAAGAVTLSKAKSVEEAVDLLAKGITGAGQFNSTVFKCQNMSESDLRAASSLLELDSGLLRLKREMAGN